MSEEELGTSVPQDNGDAAQAPADVAEAAEVLQEEEAPKLAAHQDAIYLNDKLFLNTASVGAYTDFVRIREKYERRIGKPLAEL
mgnify:CR=1 FL=1